MSFFVFYLLYLKLAISVATAVGIIVVPENIAGSPLFANPDDFGQRSLRSLNTA